MKKQIKTNVVATTILDSAKSKLNIALQFAEKSKINIFGARLFAEKAKEELMLLETILYCEKENKIAFKIQDIRIKLATKIIDLGDIVSVSKECCQDIKDLQYEIAKELDESYPSNIGELLMANNND